MIIRISGEGQYEVDDAALGQLNELDAAVEASLGAQDAEFAVALAALLGMVREAGEQVPDEALVESDVILPASDATADDVRSVLKGDGLIPG